MESLSTHWFVEGHIDFEYKKYVLLAYLQNVDQAFERSRLYPHLGELVHHYQVLGDYIHKTEAIREGFPKRMRHIELENFRLSFERVVEDDDLMKEIDEIVNYSHQAIQEYIEEGRKIYDWLEEHFELQEVGLAGLQRHEGLLLVQNGGQAQTKAYRFQVARYRSNQENYLRLKTEFLAAYTLSALRRNYQQMKQRLVKQFSSLAHQTAYAVESEWTLPEKETFWPIAQRLLLRRVREAGLG
jgi:hypothetical protein